MRCGFHVDESVRRPMSMSCGHDGVMSCVHVGGESMWIGWIAMVQQTRAN